MYAGMLGIYFMWSRNDETHSVGPLEPLTIGLIPWGILWSFLRKCMHCVLTLSEGCRYSCEHVSKWPASFMLSTIFPMPLAIEAVESESSGL